MGKTEKSEEEAGAERPPVAEMKTDTEADRGDDAAGDEFVLPEPLEEGLLPLKLPDDPAEGLLFFEEARHGERIISFGDVGIETNFHSPAAILIMPA